MSTGSNSICYGFCRDIYFFKMADTFQPTLELKLCIVHVSTCRSEARAVKRTLRGPLMSGNERFTWTQSTTKEIKLVSACYVEI